MKSGMSILDILLLVLQIFIRAMGLQPKWGKTCNGHVRLIMGYIRWFLSLERKLGVAREVHAANLIQINAYATTYE